MLGLDIAYLHTKYDHSVFSRSGDIMGTPKFKWFAWPDHAPFVHDCHIGHPSARTCNCQHAYQIWSLYLRPLRTYKKGYKMGCFGAVRVTQNHWK